MDKHYVLIDTVDKFHEAVNHLAEVDYVAYDTETTGLNVRKEKVIGFSFTGRVAHGYYFPLFYWSTSSNQLLPHPFSSPDRYLRLLEILKQRKLIMHNASFDVRVTLNYLKINFLASLHADTQLMEHTLNEEGPFALKEVCTRKSVELGLDSQDFANQEQLELKESVIRNGGKWIDKQKDIHKGDLAIVSKYACADVDLTLRLFKHNEKLLIQENLHNFFYNQEVMPLQKYVTIRMEHRGVHIDLKRLQELHREIADTIVKYEKEVVESLYAHPSWQLYIDKKLQEIPISNKGSFAQELCTFANLELPKSESGKFSVNKKSVGNLPDSKWKDFLTSNDPSWLSSSDILSIRTALFLKENESPYLINIQSKSQLGDLVFNFMGIEPVTKTAKGSPQFNESFVEGISKDQPWAEKLRVYNKLNKIKSSYYDRFLENHENGVYYPTFKQHGTTSGRYSSDFQQLPRPKEEDSVEHELVIKYNDSIRELVIPPPGYKFIDDDYESLEPRCVDENSLVFEYDKGLLRIKDLLVDDKVLTVDGFRKVLAKFKSEKPSLKIITRKGVLVCSEEHKIFVNGKWTVASDIKVGDVLEECKFDYESSADAKLPVYLKNATNKPFAFKTISVDEAWMLGAFLGDGVYSYKSRYVGICGLLEDGVIEKFTNFFKQYGLVEVKCRDNRTTSNVQTHTYNNIELVNHFIHTYKVASEKGKVMRVPEYILNAKEDIKLAFLAGLVDTDGTYNTKKSELSISSKYPEFLSELISLGNTLGLDGRIGLSHSKSLNKKCYQLRFTAVSINKLFKQGFSLFQVVERKKLFKECMVGKKESPVPFVLEILKENTTPMIDITVEENHEFVCNNLRVHNCFADDAGDEALINIFTKNLDMYSVVAIMAEDIRDASADKKAENFLKKKYPQKRQNAKAYALGIRYGMKEFKLAKSLDISEDKAAEIIANYFKAFPGLKAKMDKYLREVKTTGKVTSKFGRVRHLPRAKEIYQKFGDGILDFRNLKKISIKTGVPMDELRLIRKEYNNLLNNALNFPIQSAATSIVNRAAIAMTRQFIENKMDAWVSLQIHDQLVTTCKEELCESGKTIVQYAMEETNKLSMPLVAKPEIAGNLREGH